MGIDLSDMLWTRGYGSRREPLSRGKLRDYSVVWYGASIIQEKYTANVLYPNCLFGMSGWTSDICKGINDFPNDS
jgi:hypothetical protein